MAQTSSSARQPVLPLKTIKTLSLRNASLGELNLFKSVWTAGVHVAADYFYSHISDSITKEQEESLEKFVQFLLDESSTFGIASTGCSWLVCGQNPANLLDKLAKENEPTACGYVWKDNEVAYNCENCQHDDSCAICESCFRNGNHEGHNWRMIHVGAGGCCDCGDPESWAREGFCSKHRGNTEENDGDPRLKLPHKLSRAVSIVSRVVLRTLARAIGQRDRHYMFPAKALAVLRPQFVLSSTPSQDSSQCLHVALLANDDVHSFDEVTEALRKALPGLPTPVATTIAMAADHYGKTLVAFGNREQCEVVRKILEGIRPQPLQCEVAMTTECAIVFDALVVECADWLDKIASVHNGIRRAVWEEAVATVVMAPSVDHGDAPQSHLVIRPLMQSFSVMAKDISEALQRLFFQLMKDPSFKQIFAEQFVSLYGALARDFVRGIVRWNESLLGFSVQLLTLPTITLHLVARQRLLDVLLDTVEAALTTALAPLPRQPYSVVQPSASVISNGRAGLLVHNIESVVAVDTVGRFLCGSPAGQAVLGGFAIRWAQILRWMQGMHTCTRLDETSPHVLFENSDWAAALDLSLKASAVDALLADALKAAAAAAVATPIATDPTVAMETLRVVLRPYATAFAEWLFEPRAGGLRRLSTIALPEATGEDAPATSALVHAFGEANAPLTAVDSTALSAVFEYDVTVQPITIHLPLQRAIARMLLIAAQLCGNSAQRLWREMIVPVFSEPLSLNDTTDERTQRQWFGQYFAEHAARLPTVIVSERLGEWVRNGSEILALCVHYSGPLLCDQMFCLDLAVLQIAAAMVSHGDDFVVPLAAKFDALTTLGAVREPTDQSPYDNLTHDADTIDNPPTKRRRTDDIDDEAVKRTTAMAEEFLFLLITLLTERDHTAPVSTRDAMRRHVIHRLWITGRAAFTEIAKGLSARWPSHAAFEGVLADVARFARPSATEPKGTFDLRPECVDEVDMWYPYWTVRTGERARAEEKFREWRSRKRRAGAPAMPACQTQKLPQLFAAFAELPANLLLRSAAVHRMLFNVLVKAAFTESQLPPYYRALLRDFVSTHALIGHTLRLLQLGLVELEGAFLEVVRRPLATHRVLGDVSIASLLAVFHRSLSASPSPFAITDPEILGIFREFQEELDWLTARLGVAPAAPASPPLADANETAQSDWQRRAREARQRAMEDMQRRQAEFLRRSSDVVAADAVDTAVADAAECVLCREVLGGFFGEKPHGLLANIQRTNVVLLSELSFTERATRAHTLSELSYGQAAPTPTNTAEPLAVSTASSTSADTPASVAESAATLMSTVSTPTGTITVDTADATAGMASAGGITYYFCGHAMHFECYQTYCNSLLQRHNHREGYEGLGAIDLERGDILCPLCKRLCNVVVPAVDMPASAAIQLTAHDTTAALAYRLMQQNACKPVASVPTLQATSPAAFDALDSFASKMVCIFTEQPFPATTDPQVLNAALCSLTAYAIKVHEIAARFDDAWNPSEISIANKEISMLGTVLRAVRAYFDHTAGAGRPLEDYAARTVREHLAMFAGNAERGTDPILGADLLSLCVWMVAMQHAVDTGDTQDERAYFGAVAMVTLRACAVQALLNYRLRIAGGGQALPDAPVAMATANAEFAESLVQIQAIMQRELALPEMPANAPQMSANALAFYVAQRLLPLARCLSIMHAALFGTDRVGPLPSDQPAHIDPLSELQAHIGYLKLSALQTLFEGSSPIGAASLARWCALLSDSGMHDRTTVSYSIPMLSVPGPFRLTELPAAYNDFLLARMKEACRRCHRVPKEPAVCLVCNTLLCAAERCCRAARAGGVDGAGECTVHAEACGAGVAVFLLVRRAAVVLCYHGLAYRVRSVYLDAHGEEDYGLERGRPLSLDPERLEQLRVAYVRQRLMEESFAQRLRMPPQFL